MTPFDQPDTLPSRVPAEPAEEASPPPSSDALRAPANGRRGVGAWWCDLASGVLTWDEATYRLHGMDPDGQAGAHEAWAAALHPDDRTVILSQWDRAREEGTGMHAAYRVRLPGGAVREMEAHASAAELPPTGRRTLMGLTLDVTEERRAERRHLRSAAEAEALLAARTADHAAALAELDVLAQAVTHELNAPLGELAAHVSLLLHEEASRLSDEGVRLLARIREGAGRTRGLLDTLTAFALVGRTPLRRETVDLTALARDVAETRRARPGGQGLSVAVQDGLSCVADAALLRLAMAGIFDYALTRTAPGREGMVEVDGAPGPEGRLVVRLHVPPAGARDASAPSVEAPNRAVHGLGLATARHVVRRHGGRMWVEGDPSGSTALSLTLPRE